MTQASINEAVNSVLRFNGQRIAMANGNYMGECTAPITWMLHTLQLPIPPMHNNRADGWAVAHPSELVPYFSFEPYQAGRAYPFGTIMMWDSPHIAIVLHSDGSNTVNVFEQNADPNGSPCKTANRVINNEFHRAIGVMVPIVEALAPAPPPTPRYTITETYSEGRQIVLNKDTNLWGMNYDFTTMVKNPVEAGHKAGEIWTVTNRVHHEDGYDYYRREGQVDGFNVLDCDDYTPPPPPPYVPPAAPLPVPINVVMYRIVTTIMTWPSAQDASNRTKAATTITPGQYQLLKTAMNGMLYVTKQNDEQQRKFWINPADNVDTPKPEPVVAPEPPEPKVSKLSDADKASFVSFTADRQPVTYVMEYGFPFVDLNGYSNKTVHRSQYDEVPFSGTFSHDGKEWARVFIGDADGNLDINRWFAIPLLNPITHTPYITPHDVVYSPQTTPVERIATHHPTPFDKFIEFGTTVDILYDKAIRTIDGIFRPKKHK